MPTAAAPQKMETEETPLQLRIGSATITPVGFMDFTAVYRSTNPGSGPGAWPSLTLSHSSRKVAAKCEGLAKPTSSATRPD